MVEKDIELIEKSQLFKGFSRKKVDDILKSIKYSILKFKTDEHVAFRGDKIKGAFINLEGVLVAEMLKENGDVKRIEEFESGKLIAAAFIFGDFNMFPVDLISKSDTTILFIEKKEFINIFEKEREILIRFLDEVSNKAQFLSKNLWESVANKTINKKLAEYILKNEEGGYFTLTKSIKELSEYFNVSRPSLSRVIKQLIESGIIERLEKGKYRVILREELEKI